MDFLSVIHSDILSLIGSYLRTKDLINLSNINKFYCEEVYKYVEFTEITINFLKEHNKNLIKRFRRINVCTIYGCDNYRDKLLLENYGIKRPIHEEFDYNYNYRAIPYKLRYLFDDDD